LQKIQRTFFIKIKDLFHNTGIPVYIIADKVFERIVCKLIICKPFYKTVYEIRGVEVENPVIENQVFLWAVHSDCSMAEHFINLGAGKTCD